MGKQEASALRAGAIMVEHAIIGGLIPLSVKGRVLSKDEGALLIKQLRGVTETMLTLAMKMEAGAA